MSVINAPTLQDTVYSGDCPLAVAHGSATLAAAQVGDKVRLNKLFAGTKVYGAKLINAALGANVVVDLGFEYANGEAGGVADAFLNDANGAVAGAKESAAAPVTLAYDAYLVATIAGAAATGKIDTVVTYEFKGL